MNDVVNVAHVAGKDGKCVRCGTPLGRFVQVADADVIDGNGHPAPPIPAVDRPWEPNERVVEYEMPNGRTAFADWVAGVTIDCIP